MNSEGNIWRHFRNRRGVVDCKPQAPGGMGYKLGLYTIEGMQPEYKQQVESRFMEPLDTAADRVHRLLLDGHVRALTDEQCSRWAGLIMSLWFRTPCEVDGIRSAVDALYEHHLTRSALDPEGPIELPEAARNQLAMDILMRSIDNEQRGSELINMHWEVIEVDHSRELFISDSPLSQSIGLSRLVSPAASLLSLSHRPNCLLPRARPRLSTQCGSCRSEN